MEYIPARTIITKTKNEFWFGSYYNMNIYRGCNHGCIYCDSRSDCYNVVDFDTVKAKENAMQILRSNLISKRVKEVVGMGAMSDPYNPFEKQYELTRQSLELINTYEFGISLTTKSPLVVRDIDIFNKIKVHSPVLIQITITTFDDELCKKIEPGTFSSSERFKALKTLADNGINCGVVLMPILPFINDSEENILSIVRKAKENGAKFVYPMFGVSLRDGQREYFYDKLDELFPNLKDKYINKYGYNYNCQVPNSKELYNVFAKECKKLGLLYKMKDIIEFYKSGYRRKQMSFWDL